MAENPQVGGKKQIARNTALLYVRMAVMMVISFFTARIMLNALGVMDYGVNNAVGGLVSMFSLISASLSSSVGRFLTFGLGENNPKRLNTIFCMSVNIHLILAVVVVLAIEIGGVWFLNNKMNIPPERLTAAHWVLQCSTVVFALGLFSVPYNSLIVAHEKMSAFAYMTIFDAISRLAVVAGIYYYGGDKLILLALLMLAQSSIRQSVYWIYCRRKFEEASYHYVWDRNLGKEMFGFAGWNFIGCTAVVLKEQGVNILINIFSGPAVNAARGIAMQMNAVIGQFIGSFTIALNPQIIKGYAAGELDKVHELVFWGSRLSYYLFMLLSIPILFEAEQVLYLWLGQVPEHTVLFVRLVLILSLAEVISNTLITAQVATGKIRNYQIVVGGLFLLIFPVSYMLLEMGWFPEVTVIVAIVVSQVCLLARLWFLRTMIKLSAWEFLKKVYFNVLAVTAVALILPAFCYESMPPSVLRLLILGLVSVFASILSIYYVGCNQQERVMILGYVRRFKQKLVKSGVE